MYLEFYGLTLPPFDITPNPRFLFLTEKHREAINHLLYGIRERKGYVQLTGEVGAGKTTVCRAMLRQLDSHFSTALIVNPVLSANELMRAIATEFGLEAKGLDRHDTVAAINSFLVQQVQQCGDAVLIIDEAQNLTEELLEQVRLLSNLEMENRKLLQIILLGQPELRDRLNSPRLRQLRQRITVRYHLNPLTRPGAFATTAAAFPAWSTPSATRRCSPALSNTATASPTAWWAAPSANSKGTSTYEPDQQSPQTIAAKTITRRAAVTARGIRIQRRPRLAFAVAGGFAGRRRWCFNRTGRDQTPGKANRKPAGTFPGVTG